jgi:hypothetical protein
MGGNLGAPGTRTTRQENTATEFTLPLLQALGRVFVDGLAVVFIVVTLIMLGRWAIWGLITLALFSTGKENVDAWLQAHLVGFGARVAEIVSFALPWLWFLFGWLALWFIWPFTWGISGGWHGLVVETLRPVVGGGWQWYGVAMIALHPFWRLFTLVLALVPLATWGAIRDRFKWELWLVVPTTAVPVQDAGLDPHKWGPKPEPAPARSDVRPVEVWYTHTDDDDGDTTEEEFNKRARDLEDL